MIKEIMNVGDLEPGMTFSMIGKDDPGGRWVLDRGIPDGEEVDGVEIRNQRRNIWSASPVKGGRAVLVCFDRVFAPSKYFLRCHD